MCMNLERRGWAEDIRGKIKEKPLKIVTLI